MQIFRKMVNDCLSGVQETLDTYNVRHDRWDFESELGWEVCLSLSLDFFLFLSLSLVVVCTALLTGLAPIPVVPDLQTAQRSLSLSLSLPLSLCPGLTASPQGSNDRVLSVIKDSPYFVPQTPTQGGYLDLARFIADQGMATGKRVRALSLCLSVCLG
jgi:hypothetical protein